MSENPRSRLETRLGMQPLEELHAERDLLVTECADLHARYGPGGTYDDLRKAELMRIRAMLRAQYHAARVTSVTEARLDEEAHSHPDYTQIVTDATIGRARLYRLINGIKGIDERIDRDNRLSYHSAAEARLG